MNKKAFMKGLRKFFMGSTAVGVAAFAIIGASSMVDKTKLIDWDAVGSGKSSVSEAQVHGSQLAALLDKNMDTMQARASGRILMEAYDTMNKTASHEVSYTAVSTMEDYRELGFIKVPGTRKYMVIECPGTVTAYWDLEEMSWDTDTNDHTIYVTLPESISIENVLDESSMYQVGSNNFLNAVTQEDVEACIADLKAKGLEQAEADGLYEDLQAEAERIVTEAFKALYGYRVLFMDNVSLDNVTDLTAPDEEEVQEEEEPVEESDTEDPYTGDSYTEEDPFAGQDRYEEETTDGNSWFNFGGWPSGNNEYSNDYGYSDSYGDDSFGNDTYESDDTNSRENFWKDWQLDFMNSSSSKENEKVYQLQNMGTEKENHVLDLLP